jgi:transposase
MAKSYSKDLRSRIVDSYKNREGSMRKLSKRYKVSKNFIYRLLKRNRQEGTILPKPQGGSQPSIQGAREKYLRCVLKAEPDLTLEALRERYYQAFGDKLGITTIYDTLKRWGISRKQFYDPEQKTARVQSLTQAYHQELANIE